MKLYKNNKHKKNERNLRLTKEKQKNNTFLCKNDHFFVGPYSKLNNDAFDK